MRGRDDALVTTRRGLLIIGLAGSAAALTGCHIPGTDRDGAGATRSPADPLEPVLGGALSLVSQYDAVIAARPGLATRLAQLRAECWTHVTALAGAMGRSTPSSAPGAGTSPAAGPSVAADDGSALAALRAAEKAAQSDVGQICLTAPGRYAELLGSITACHAIHVEVLT